MISDHIRQMIRDLEPDEEAALAGLKCTSEILDAPPFRRLRKLVVKVAAPNKQRLLQYMTDGFHLLATGSDEAVVRITHEEGLHIDANNVVDYAKFYLQNTQRSTLYIVENSDEARWFPFERHETEYETKKEQAEFLIRPVQMRELGDGSYDIKLTAIDQRILYLISLRIWPDCHVDGVVLKEIVRDIPVPYIIEW